MKHKLLIRMGLAGGLMLAGQVQAAWIIDDFNTGQAVPPCTDTDGSCATNIYAPNIVGNGVGNGSDTSATGWTRSLSAVLLSGDRVEAQVCANCQAGHHVSGAAGTVGNTDFEYNGTSVNLVTMQMDGTVTFDYAADLDGGEVVFTFDDGSGSESSVSSGALANTNSSSDINDPNNRTSISLALPGGVDFSDLTSVTIDILGVPDLDFTIDNVGIPVPEPATLALLGLGIAGMFGWQQRRSSRTA